ncbi:hypothetical protein F383_22813 [Gossypium arboreum]|uniref:Uncharacterized protein n=1 Tax=Gossypium arboreum TaxID=29729 RepID=A0A0B0NMC5_GOSAR|nr:hypothetical protein F383_22813 [Gossypium arboreum]
MPRNPQKWPFPNWT